MKRSTSAILGLLMIILGLMVGVAIKSIPQKPKDSVKGWELHSIIASLPRGDLEGRMALKIIDIKPDGFLVSIQNWNSNQTQLLSEKTRWVERRKIKWNGKWEGD